RAEVFNNLGILAKTQGKTHEALQWLRRSVEVDSTYARGYFNLAALYAAMGNTAAATEALRHAARLGYLPAREQLKQSATNQ
ncbi:MAG TPA: tetratricopeptide repeat protein, partial [Bacteroidota bacterium]|nr:tetratricopeptide repeat protein [Bacteroidota bacterium]